MICYGSGIVTVVCKHAYNKDAFVMRKFIVFVYVDGNVRIKQIVSLLQ